MAPTGTPSAARQQPASQAGGALAAAWAARPDLAPWIHSLKVFGAAMLALYAALALSLPRPYWRSPPFIWFRARWPAPRMPRVPTA